LSGKGYLRGNPPPEIRLPEDLKRVLSLGDSETDAAARDMLEGTLAGNLITGRAPSGHKGIPIYGVGEVATPFEWEDSGDEWDGGRCEWSGEL